MRRIQKPWMKMTLEELQEATKEFDRPETTPPATKPSALSQARVDFALGRITPEQFREIAAQYRGVSRPKNGQVTKFSIGLRRDLLSRADAWGKRRKLSRADVIERGLELLLAKR